MASVVLLASAISDSNWSCLSPRHWKYPWAYVYSHSQNRLTCPKAWCKNCIGLSALTMSFRHAGMAIDSRGNVFIADRGNHCIWIYTCGGQYVSKTGKHGSAPGELNYPYGVAIDKKGNIFVSESGNHRISMFRPGGKFVRCFGKKGSEPGMFLYPRHLCVDSQGRLVVADEQNHRLQIFNILDKFDWFQLWLCYSLFGFPWPANYDIFPWPAVLFVYACTVLAQHVFMRMRIANNCVPLWNAEVLHLLRF